MAEKGGVGEMEKWRNVEKVEKSRRRAEKRGRNGWREKKKDEREKGRGKSGKE